MSSIFSGARHDFFSLRCRTPRGTSNANANMEDLIGDPFIYNQAVYVKPPIPLPTCAASGR